MEIREINNKELWERFLGQCKEKTFLNSWNWGEFQKKIEEKIWRFGLYDNEQLIAVVLVIKVKAKRGTFLFVPHGPNIINPKQTQNSKFQILNTLLIKLKELAKKEGVSFIRMAPILERNEENIKVFKKFGFKEAPIHIHPELTWELELNPPENDLLMEMRKTTRYLIRQAQKNPDIEIIRSQKIEDLTKFNDIYYATAERHKFVPFSLDYLQKQFSCFLPDNQILIFFGKYKGEIISSAIIIYWQNIGFYHHGASLSKYNSNKVPISYLLQWEAIKEAKNRGCEKYNFWGIAPEGKKNHPWTGLTLFKMGFGGRKKEYVRSQDLPMAYSYWLTFIFEKLRKFKRGL